MKTVSIILTAVVLLVSTQAVAGKWKGPGDDYKCIVIEKFLVDREGSSTTEMARAATIPEETLTSLQNAIVGELEQKGMFDKVAKSSRKGCGAKALVFGGKVTEYKQGNRAARLLVGWGAGKQKFKVDCYIRDKQSGETLATKTVVDRKVGGLAGGDEEKGERDFAEKVVKFIKGKK